VLPSRLEIYDPSMLDMLCLAGEVAWGRLSPGIAGGASVPHLVPATPVALFLREHGDAWHTLAWADGTVEQTLDASARKVLETLRQRGASFLNDLSSSGPPDREELRKTMGMLVACGLARSDGFSGLRTLLSTNRGHAALHNRVRFTGRWSATPWGPVTIDHDQAVAMHAWGLLRRYGIVFRRLLTRETITVSWRELTRVYRRLEARGEIRGGRFVSGMSGEQFALPDAVDRLREVRRTKPDGQLITISTADPLNLVGILTPDDRIRPAVRNKLVYRDGRAVAVQEGQSVRELSPIDSTVAAELSRLFSQRRVPSMAR
jgi:ATP-dependent Lhr-like helicase